MTNPTIRWGILSTAGINDALIEPIRQAGRSQLVAVASRNEQKAQAYAQEKNIPRAYGSYESLLADPEIDAIYNPLPNTLHREWTVKAAEAGKHVLCEKPLVLSLPDLDAIEAAAQANNVTIFEAFMYLHHPETRQALKMIQAGQLGDIHLINAWFAFYLPPEAQDNIRLQPGLGGGCTWDVGVYPNSLAIVMAQAGGPPVEVWACQRQGETGVDVSTMAQMRFANGVVAQISASFRTPPRAGAQIIGSRGLLHIDDPWKAGRDRLYTDDTHLLFRSTDGEEETVVNPPANPYQAEVEAMEACILDGAEPVVPLSLSRDFLRSILAIYQSAESGRPVTL